MWPARWKLVSLWFSQVARVTADNALRLFVCLEYAHEGAAQKNSAWHLVTALFIAPAILLAPFNGALCNTLPKPLVLRGTALFGFLVSGAFFLINDHVMLCWALIAIGSAIYGPTRYAMLPAAAEDTHWPLTRITGLFETGVAAAVIAGMFLVPGMEMLLENNTGRMVLAVIFVCNGLALLGALPVAFPHDVHREDRPIQAVRGFFSDCRAIGADREARICLAGLSGLRGVIIGMTGVFLARAFDEENFFRSVFMIAVWVAGGTALGSLLAGAQRHPRRVLGFVPLGALGMTAGLLWAAVDDSSGPLPYLKLCGLFGFMAGLINVPLAATYQIVLPPDARGNGMAVRNMTDYLGTVVTAVALFLLGRYGGAAPVDQLWCIAALAGAGTLAAWWIFRREVTELFLEGVFAVMYRFRFAGPGLDSFPLRGPVIVVANHSAWLDPMWLGKVLPRSLTPMMTSVFFDNWLLRWTMIYLVDAIRVQESRFRREVPELKAAVAALDAGKCVVLFPEGRLRRNEQQPLRMFGQGVWHILRERPLTPVVVCWIEGGWGSFFSYFNGYPTKNKRFDIRRPLAIAVREPQIIAAEILADQRQTRHYLMAQCLEAREYLGLAPLQVEKSEEETESPAEA